MPLFIRSICYFLYLYIIKLGFLDGKEGFIWHLLQGLWYRFLVDVKIYQILKETEGDPKKIKDYFAKEYQLKF
jgi:hypothetical protein